MYKSGLQGLRDDFNLEHSLEGILVSTNFGATNLAWLIRFLGPSRAWKRWIRHQKSANFDRETDD